MACDHPFWAVTFHFMITPVRVIGALASNSDTKASITARATISAKPMTARSRSRPRGQHLMRVIHICAWRSCRTSKASGPNHNTAESMIANLEERRNARGIGTMAKDGVDQEWAIEMGGPAGLARRHAQRRSPHASGLKYGRWRPVHVIERQTRIRIARYEPPWRMVGGFRCARHRLLPTTVGPPPAAESLGQATDFGSLSPGLLACWPGGDDGGSGPHP
jgi:hypothetical protein